MSLSSARGATDVWRMSRFVPEPDAGRLFLTLEECLQVLADVATGRVNFTRHALPQPIPMRCRVEGPDLVLRTDASGLERLLDAAVVAVEADLADPVSGTGWRVVVIGPTERRGSGLHVHPHEVSGHRLPAPRVA